MTDEQESTPQDAPQAMAADPATEAGNSEPEAPRVTAPPRAFDDEPPEGSAEAPTGAATEPDEDAEAAGEPEVIEEQAEPEAPAAFEDLSELPALLEALLFVADHPVDVGYLSRALEVSQPRVEHALDGLAEALRAGRRGIRVQRGPAGVQLVSAPEAATQVERFLGLEASRRLSTAALETLAIIAYRQPVTRGQVDAIRGVSSDGAIATLRSRDLIEAAGHASGPGRPTLFRTTQRFLEHFGLERPGQLPPLPDDIDLPPAEIGEQLGLEEALVLEALRPRESVADDDEAIAAPEADAEGDTASVTSASDELEAEVVELDTEDEVSLALAQATTPDVEIPSDPRALSQAAEQAFEAFEASRERQASGGDIAAPSGEVDDAATERRAD